MSAEYFIRTELGAEMTLFLASRNRKVKMVPFHGIF